MRKRSLGIDHLIILSIGRSTPQKGSAILIPPHSHIEKHEIVSQVLV